MHRKSVLILTAFFTCLLWIPAAAHSEDQGTVLATYRVTETVKQDGCFPERKAVTRAFTWYLVKFPDQTVLVDLTAAILNPIEHPSLVVQSTKGNAIKAQDRLSMTYGQYGVFTSEYDADFQVNGENLNGTYVNHMDFKPGTLGLTVLDLWVQSYWAFEKVPVRVDTIPAISVAPPCKLTGSLTGIKINDAKPIEARKELDYIRDMRRAEELFSLTKVKESLPYLERITQYAPERPDAFWRLSRAYFVFSEHLDPEDKAGRLKNLAQAERYARGGLKANSESGESWFFLTAALGRTATTKGILSAIKATGDLERGFLAAAARKPRYNFAGFATAGDTQCGLGIYYRLVPDWWIVKVLTGTRGNIDKAVNHLREAIRYQPYRVEYNKELGVSLLCRGHRKNSKSDIEEGLNVLKKTLTYPTLLVTDGIDKKHIEELIKNHEKACGYSRDGYEDTSMQAYNDIHGKPAQN